MCSGLLCSNIDAHSYEPLTTFVSGAASSFCIPQMGVEGFAVTLYCPCHFKNNLQNSANQSEEGGGKGAGG